MSSTRCCARATPGPSSKCSCPLAPAGLPLDQKPDRVAVEAPARGNGSEDVKDSIALLCDLSSDRPGPALAGGDLASDPIDFLPDPQLDRSRALAVAHAVGDQARCGRPDV